jgi:hypothetical protein
MGYFVLNWKRLTSQIVQIERGCRRLQRVEMSTDFGAANNRITVISNTALDV